MLYFYRPAPRGYRGELGDDELRNFRQGQFPQDRKEELEADKDKGVEDKVDEDAEDIYTYSYIWSLCYKVLRNR